MDQAKNNLNASDDFKSELKVARREIRKLEMERDLADRLAEAANAVIDQWETPNWRLRESTAKYMNTLRNNLAAWKEARDGSR